MRFVHRRRFRQALKLLEAEPTSRVLDFGSGDGFLLAQLLPHVTSGRLVAFEPLEELRKPMTERFARTAIEVTGDRRDLAGQKFDRIACLEVLEHLQPRDLDGALQTLWDGLDRDGILVVSVPVEIGPSVLFKYAAERMITGSDRHYSVWEVLRASVGGHVPRDPDVDFLPHKGFDHRTLRRVIAERFQIERQQYAPLPLVRGAFNSQVLWRLRL
jgi:cyclopropane fatty-acyl-phospholipid synthase-like methyltransferase